MSIETTCHIGCLVVNKVAGPSAKPFQHEVERWIRENGIEWTCSRLKAVWTAAMHLKEGKPDLAVLVYRENSISYDHATKLPKGAVKPIVKNFLAAQHPSALRRWAAVLRFYTGLRLDKVSKKQFLKAKASINSEPKFGKHYEMLTDRFKRFIEIEFRRNHLWKAVTPDWSYSDARYLRGTVSYYSPVRVPKDMKGLPYSRMVMSLMTKPWVPESLSDFVPCKEARSWDEESLSRKGLDDPYVGKITFLQEQGCKARVVAQPSAYLQLAFLPLKKALKEVTEKCYHKQSCVTHQTDGAWFALNSLNQGDTLESVDLSSATDRFPLEWQCLVLDALGLEIYSKALREVSHAKWLAVPDPTDPSRNEVFTYSAGQPMGLNGSFDLFSLTNLLTARFAGLMVAVSKARSGKENILKAQGLDPKPYFEYVSGLKGSSRILGDDIIFNDLDVAKTYRDILKEMDVQVQSTKCYQGRVGEFAGFVILPSKGENFTAFRPYKVPSQEFVTNPAEFLHALGIKGANLSRKWAKRFIDYRHTLPRLDLDLSPLNPDEDPKVLASVRADISWVESLANRFRMVPEVNVLLPDLWLDPDGRPTTKVNSVPLFKERGPFDWYGFNPELYTKHDVSVYERNGMKGIQCYATMDKSPIWKQWRLQSVDNQGVDAALEQELTKILSNSNEPNLKNHHKGRSSVRRSSDGLSR